MSAIVNDVIWKCPVCEAGRHGIHKVLSPGCGCPGLTCWCRRGQKEHRDHGGEADPCDNAECGHCGWRGTLPAKPVLLDYTNHRGERRERRVLPGRIWYGTTKWHPEAQWLMQATDLERGEQRDFAMAQIHGWRAA